MWTPRWFLGDAVFLTWAPSVNLQSSGEAGLGGGNNMTLAINYLVGSFCSLLFCKRMGRKESVMGSACIRGHQSPWPPQQLTRILTTYCGEPPGHGVCERADEAQVRGGGGKQKRAFQNMDVYYPRPTQANHLLDEGQKSSRESIHLPKTPQGLPGLDTSGTSPTSGDPCSVFFSRFFYYCL